MKKFLVILLMLFPFAVSATPGANSSIAPERLAALGKRVADARYARCVQPKKASTNFSGGWNGRFVLVRSSCSDPITSFLFRHIISMNGNAVRITTSHDGTLYGTSKKGGTQLQVTTTYDARNSHYDVAMIYGSLKGNQANVGLGAVITSGDGQCAVSYGATSIRAF